MAETGRPIEVKRPGSRRSVSRSASRALDVLELFGEARRPVRAIEIGRALDMHPSTVNQLLKTLVESGHLAFDGRAKTYFPSPRLIDFGAWIVSSYGAGDDYRRLLEEIHGVTGAVVTLTAPNDLFMQVVEVAGPLDWAERTPPGLHVSLFASPAVGNAYLAAIPDREIERLYERARLPRTAFAGLLETIAGVRREGVAEGDSADGAFLSVAMPLPGAGPLPLVVGLADRTDRVGFDRRFMIDTLRSSVARWAGSRAPYPSSRPGFSVPMAS